MSKKSTAVTTWLTACVLALSTAACITEFEDEGSVDEEIGSTSRELSLSTCSSFRLYNRGAGKCMQLVDRWAWDRVCSDFFCYYQIVTITVPTLATCSSSNAAQKFNFEEYGQAQQIVNTAYDPDEHLCIVTSGSSSLRVDHCDHGEHNHGADPPQAFWQAPTDSGYFKIWRHNYTKNIWRFSNSINLTNDAVSNNNQWKVLWNCGYTWKPTLSF